MKNKIIYFLFVSFVLFFSCIPVKIPKNNLTDKTIMLQGKKGCLLTKLKINNNNFSGFNFLVISPNETVNLSYKITDENNLIIRQGKKEIKPFINKYKTENIIFKNIKNSKKKNYNLLLYADNNLEFKFNSKIKYKYFYINNAKITGELFLENIFIVNGKNVLSDIYEKIEKDPQFFSFYIILIMTNVILILVFYIYEKKVSKKNFNSK